jgi:hypothetical protein
MYLSILFENRKIFLNHCHNVRFEKKLNKASVLQVIRVNQGGNEPARWHLLCLPPSSFFQTRCFISPCRPKGRCHPEGANLLI